MFRADAVDVREEDLGSLYSSDVCALNPNKSLMCQQLTALRGRQRSSVCRRWGVVIHSAVAAQCSL